MYAFNKSDGTLAGVYNPPINAVGEATERFYTSPVIDGAEMIYIGGYSGNFAVFKFRFSQDTGNFNSIWISSGGMESFPRTPILSEEGLNNEATLYIPQWQNEMLAIGPSELSLRSEKTLSDYEISLGEEVTATIKIEGRGTPARIPNDIILAMDVSGSMGWDWAGKDCGTSGNPPCTGIIKMDSAKQALDVFIEEIKNDPYNPEVGEKYDRIAYVVYGAGKNWFNVVEDKSEIREDLTDNYELVKTAIWDTEDVGPGGTPIGSGLGLANKELGPALEGGHGRDASVHKVVVLATDGKQNTSPAVDENEGDNLFWDLFDPQGPCILRKSMAENYMVYTVGIGEDVISITDVKVVRSPDCQWPYEQVISPGTCPDPIFSRCNTDPICNDPDYIPGQDIYETGECLMNRIATYTGGRYYYAGDPGALENAYQDIAQRMSRQITYPEKAEIQERLNDNMRYTGVVGATYYDSQEDRVDTYNMDPTSPDYIGYLGTLVENPEGANGFDFTVDRSLYINDEVTISFGVEPQNPGYNQLVDDPVNAKLRYEKIDSGEWIEGSIAQAWITVLGGLQVIGDVHAKNNITIQGLATGVVTAGGGTVNILGRLATIAPYTINANTTADLAYVLSNINPKNIDRLKKERAKDFSSLGDDLNPDDTPEGGVWQKTTALSLSTEGYTDRGTIIVEQGDLILGGDITVSGEGSMLGFIVENGNVIIAGNVENLRRVAIFAPNGNIIIESSPNSATISGLLVAREIIIQRNNITIEYDSRITGGIGSINGIPVIYHALPGFSQIIPPTWREGVP